VLEEEGKVLDKVKFMNVMSQTGFALAKEPAVVDRYLALDYRQY
jgi:hypothetical protein